MKSNTPLKTMTMDYLFDAIHHGEITTNDIVTENQVCTALEISRTPAREALIELTANGIMEKVPNKGYRLRETTKKDKMDIHAIWGVLDGLAAKLSLEYITEDDIKKMREIVAMADVAIEFKNYAGYCEAQDNFHKVYINKCNNAALIRHIELTEKSVTRYIYYSKDSELLFKVCHETNNEHKHIIDLFVKKDAEGLQRYISDVHWEVRYPDLI